MNPQPNPTVAALCAAGAVLLLAGCAQEDPNALFHRVYAERYDYWISTGQNPKTASLLAADEARRERQDAITPPEMSRGAPELGVILARFPEAAAGTPAVSAAQSCPKVPASLALAILSVTLYAGK